MSPEETLALAELQGLANALAPDVRARIAVGWARAAQAEHASIASFARFTLELLAVGAPPDLVRDTQRAALDEIAHAELSFAIASVYAGQSLGPGRLPIDSNVIGRVDLESVIENTVIEGCVGEALAAAEAEAARDAAIPAVVKTVLGRVAADEAAHAMLAYRFVGWALGVGDRSACAAARSAFTREIARRRDQPVLESVRESTLRTHGLLPAPERHELRLQVLTTVIEPTANALLEKMAVAGT